jgi:hypothetical protein
MYKAKPKVGPKKLLSPARQQILEKAVVFFEANPQATQEETGLFMDTHIDDFLCGG